MTNYFIIGYRSYDSVKGGMDPIVVGPFDTPGEAHEYSINNKYRHDFNFHAQTFVRPNHVPFPTIKDKKDGK